MSEAFEQALAGLKPRIASFVRHYLKGANGKQAALAAGYAESCAKTRAWQLLQDDRVQAALEAGRNAIAEHTLYDADRAMAELKEAIDFARETNNATAMCRAIELRARITGVLVDRQEIDMNGNINLAAIVAQRDARLAGHLIEQENEEAEKLALLFS